MAITKLELILIYSNYSTLSNYSRILVLVAVFKILMFYILKQFSRARLNKMFEPDSIMWSFVYSLHIFLAACFDS